MASVVALNVVVPLVDNKLSKKKKKTKLTKCVAEMSFEALLSILSGLVPKKLEVPEILETDGRSTKWSSEIEELLGRTFEL